MSAFYLRPDTKQVFLLWSLDAKTVLACPLCRAHIRVAEKINLHHGTMKGGEGICFSGMALCFACGHVFPLSRVLASPQLMLGGVPLAKPYGDWTSVSFAEQRAHGLAQSQQDPPAASISSITTAHEQDDIASAIALYYAGRHVL